MSKLILKPTTMIHPDELDRIEERIAKDLEKNGFAIISPMFEVYEIKENSEGADK